MHHHSESKTADATTGPPQNHDTVRFPLSDWGKDAHRKSCGVMKPSASPDHRYGVLAHLARCYCGMHNLRVEVEPFSNYWRRSQWHKKSGSQ